MVRDDPAQQPQGLPGHVLGAAPPAAPLQGLHETLDPLGQFRALGSRSGHLESSRLDAGIHTSTTTGIALPGRTRLASALREKTPVLQLVGHAPRCHPFHKPEPIRDVELQFSFNQESARLRAEGAELASSGWSDAEEVSSEASRGELVPLPWEQLVLFPCH